MDTVRFPYRSPSHLPFLNVVDESGAWENQGLDVEYDFYIGMEDSHAALANGEVEFVGGSHLSPYAERTRGDDWVYLGQMAGDYRLNLAVRPDSGISEVPDLRGAVVANKGGHPGLNTWLFLHQNGLDVDEGDFEFEQVADKRALIDAVHDEDADAAFLTAPWDLFAEREGLQVIPVDPLPMIHFTTASSSQSYVEENPDVTERMLKGLIEGIAYFKTHPDRSTEVIIEAHDGRYPMDDEVAAHVYEETAEMLLPALYPSPEAIANVYQEALRRDEAAEQVNPLELWDFHYLRKIVDSGFVEQLYD